MSADYLALAIAPVLIRTGARCDARVRFDLAAGRERLSLAGLVPGRNGGVDMNASLQAVLTDAERLLVTETEPSSLAPLDEDAAVDLHARIRRARDKYVSQYRRSASARVPEHGGRGKARPMGRQAAMKAEAFEDALARVSRRVAVLARHSAAELRRERIAAARAAKAPQGAAASTLGIALPAQRKGSGNVADDRAVRPPDLQRQRATARAAGARKQAKRDSRKAGAGRTG
jgi:hypothetical protein